MDALERAHLAYQRAGRGDIVALPVEEPRYAMMSELAARFGSEQDMLMLLTAISEAVERYDPEREAVVMVQSEKGFEVSIVTPTGCGPAGELFYEAGGVRSEPCRM